MVYSLYALAGSSSLILVTKVDSLMLTAMISLQAKAVYTTVGTIAYLIEIPRRAIHHIAAPKIAQLFEKNNLKDIQRLYQALSMHQLLIGVFLFVVIYANLNSIFKLIPNHATYSCTSQVVLCLAMAKLLDSLCSIAGEIVLLSPHFRFNLLALALLGSISIASNYVMIPKFGIHGAAMATTFSCLVYNAVVCFFVYKKFNMHPFSFKLAYILGAGLATLGIVTLIPRLQAPAIDILLRSSIILLLYGGAMVRLKVSPTIHSWWKLTKAIWHKTIKKG